MGSKLPHLTDEQRRLAERGEDLRFRHLTDEQVTALTNGCGPKGGWFKPPDYRFTASCNHHDFNYWIGNKEEDRKRADRQFREALQRDVTAYRHWWWRRWWLRGVAWRYYWAVRLFGYKFFHYSESERSWKDLDFWCSIAKRHGKL